MNPIAERALLQNRRAFLGSTAGGLGAASLASLIGNESAIAAPEAGNQGLPNLPHFAPKAKRVIYLFMSGAPSQLDMYDYKEDMAKNTEKYYDKDLPEEIRKGQRLTTMTSGQKRFPLAPSIYNFNQHGQSGTWVSELLPHTAGMVDDLAVVKTMWTEAINHDPAITYIQTGNQLPGKPSLGAWLSYGLGSMNRNLPDFVVLQATWSARRDAQALFSRLWGSGFLPSKHQGVSLRKSGDPVLFLSNPPGVSAAMRRQWLDGLSELNQAQYEVVMDPETLARTAQYEMAFRMQSSVPELTNLKTETKETLDMYGPDVHKPGTFAASCLLARRMVERDVRFVQIFHRGWDQHGSLPRDLPLQCKDIDQASAALIKDLKQRGLFEDTLIVWGGEFGRTIYCQGNLTKTNYGRDHHPRCFSVWMAGAGIKGGVSVGQTDDYSYNIVSGGPNNTGYHIRDLNATILNQLGIDHNKLSVKFQGLDQRLTGVEECHLMKEILA